MSDAETINRLLPTPVAVLEAMICCASLGKARTADHGYRDEGRDSTIAEEHRLPQRRCLLIREKMCVGSRKIHKNKCMIITHLQAGLGNQMFQYAAGLALAEHRRTILKLDPGWFRYDPHQESHNRYSLNCFNIIEQFATEDEIRRIKGKPLSKSERLLKAAAKLLRLSLLSRFYTQQGTYHVAYGRGFTPRFFELPDNTYIQGLWQSENYFKPVADIIRLHFSFRFPALPPVAEVSEHIRKSGPSVAVHFRRGDYMRTAKFFEEIKNLPPDESKVKERQWLETIGPNTPLPLGYYSNAIEFLKAKYNNLTSFIFSDDIDAVEKEFRPNCRHLFVKGRFHAHDTMRLMSLCDHAIIANSSFSWWAAWLNPSDSKTVIAPAPWFPNNAASDGDIIPQSWIRLPAYPAV
ncbi:MAG: alpha-1,2-fucosyltransferase [Verrucomicrobiota bacterium]